VANPAEEIEAAVISIAVILGGSDSGHMGVGFWPLLGSDSGHLWGSDSGRYGGQIVVIAMIYEKALFQKHSYLENDYYTRQRRSRRRWRV
jgi:hypothetical protein